MTFIQRITYALGVTVGAPTAWRITARQSGPIAATVWALRVLWTRWLMVIGLKTWREL